MEWTHSNKQSVVRITQWIMLLCAVGILALEIFDFYMNFLKYWNYLKERTALSFQYYSKIKSLESCIERQGEEINSNPRLEKAKIEIAKLQEENRILAEEVARHILTEKHLVSEDEERKKEIDFLKKKIDCMNNEMDGLQKREMERLIRKDNRKKLRLSLDKLSDGISTTILASEPLENMVRFFT